MRPSTARCGGAAADSPQPASAPVRPTAATPAVAERRDEPRVDRARQHRDDDVERRLVGDAQAVDLPLLDARRLAARRRSPCRRRGRSTSGAPRGDARPRRRRRRSRARSSSSSPPNFDDERSPPTLSARTRHDSSVPERRAGSTSQQPRPLVEAEHHVHVLHGLARRALQQVVDDRHEDRAARRIDAPADVAEVRVRDVLDLGQRRLRRAGRTSRRRTPARRRRPAPPRSCPARTRT